MQQSIKFWPKHEQPRERLLHTGPASLSDAELLAIFLRTGSKQHSAVELARNMIQHFGGLNPVFDASLEELSGFHGVGATKYAHLMAVKELGRRYLEHYFHQDALSLSSSEQVLDYLRYELLGEKQEIFAVLCLDNELRKLHFKKLFFGSLNSCEISINQTLRYAIQQHASHLVIAHNHPFGHALPSEADTTLTQRLLQACELVDIQLIDHFIIAKTAAFHLQNMAYFMYKKINRPDIDKAAPTGEDHAQKSCERLA